MNNLQEELEKQKAQFVMENKVLKDQIHKLQLSKEAKEILDQNTILNTQLLQIKQILLKYWICVTKSLDDDFEEILQLGGDSDVMDILNALSIVEDARGEQQKNFIAELEKQRDVNKELESYITELEQQIDEFKAKEQNDTLRDISTMLMNEKRQGELKDQQIQRYQSELKSSSDEVRKLEQRINELTLALVSVKEEKITLITHHNQVIQTLKEKELEYLSQIQILEFKTHQDNNSGELQKSSRNSIENIKHIEKERTSSSLSRIQQQCINSPAQSQFRRMQNSTQLEMPKNPEKVQGASLAKVPYKFGK